MAISLFPHNASAYEAVVGMLGECGKAAVVHPTGTGKSFIGFRLCEDHPEGCVCWLSPSEYIFETQVENLRRAADGFVPENVRFFTYAKLMLMDEEGLSEIKPDYIILDEFHRCGAEQWGQGVQNLLRIYPKVPILGLTATNIRYLDRQRDMADELFDGHIASQMTLGEAIVRGILNPPRYVLSLYSYQAGMDHYRRKISTTRSRASRQAAEEVFDSLRRALANAQGLPDIFARHMTDPTGKYLIFCSGLDHMDEMIDKAPDWFAKVDPAPHIYRAYADDPATARAFSDFKNDTSDHLKLLYCIDMLNEGVHVDDVSGVILLRPTMSPIIYKQQIGRALAAGSSKNAVIFDVVMNVENLYSIGTIQQEMQAAITYYRYLGEYERVACDTFTVIDETQDCKRLFAELERRLNCSWDLMLEEARQYYRAHGDLMVPAKYKTENGLSLGSWLNVQRRIYSGKAAGFLTEDQVAKLDALGIVWDSYHDQVWEKNYLEAKAYFDRFGDLRVPAKYVTATGFPLGTWLATMRQHRANERTSILTNERIARLDAIGMSWDVLGDQWERNYRAAAAFYRENGHLIVPKSYISPEGIKLGYWIARLRANRTGKGRGRLTGEQVKRLDKIGMAWDADQGRWKIGFAAAVQYRQEFGDLNVPAGYETADGFKLGQWIRLKRRQYKSGTLAPDQVQDLEKIGMRWEVLGKHWQEMYEEAKGYFEVHGDLDVPRGYKTPGGYSLYLWIGKMRREYVKLSDEQTEALSRIGMGQMTEKAGQEIAV